MPEAGSGRLRAEGLACRGAEMLRMRRLPEAMSCCVAALQSHAATAEAADVMGTAFFEMGQHARAFEAWSHAVEIEPRYVTAWNHLGNALSETDRFDEAINCFRAVLNVQPQNAYAHNSLGIVLQKTGRIRAAMDEYRLAVAVGDTVAYDNLLYAMYFHAASTPREILEEHRRWDAQVARPLTLKAAPHPTQEDAERPLRIGYVGAHFRNHCQTYFTLPLLRHHDREQFEVHVYSDTERVDGWTEQLRGRVAAWHDVCGMSDALLAQRIRADRMDVLVDLTLHMGGSRLLTFARRPAPVQVTWLAYPGTTGLSAMDYRITDPYLDPPGQHDDHYSETSVRLPHTFWCFEPLEAPVPIGPLPSDAEGRPLTFGCFNNFSKLNTFTLERWARVLRELPQTHLWLRAPDGGPRDAVRNFLSARGVAPARLSFVGQLPRTPYLELYNRIDVSLDTAPANGHTTTLDALWMGVPVVTRIGETAIARGAMSLLNNLGLSDLAARDDDAFVATAVRLARDAERLRHLRRSLRSRMEASPLMDGARFTRDMEAAYRDMWRRFCAPPAPLKPPSPAPARGPRPSSARKRRRR